LPVAWFLTRRHEPKLTRGDFWYRDAWHRWESLREYQVCRRSSLVRPNWNFWAFIDRPLWFLPDNSTRTEQALSSDQSRIPDANQQKSRSFMQYTVCTQISPLDIWWIAAPGLARKWGLDRQPVIKAVLRLFDIIVLLAWFAWRRVELIFRVFTKLNHSSRLANRFSSCVGRKTFIQRTGHSPYRITDDSHQTRADFCWLDRRNRAVRLFEWVSKIIQILMP
jgi:hypothetical protein